jgi:hypothetical protein
MAAMTLKFTATGSFAFSAEAYDAEPPACRYDN